MEDIMRVKMELIEAGKWLYSKGLVSATDGNLSVRIDDRIVVTRSGVNKGKLSPEDFVIVGLDGKVLDGTGKPSSEIRMHLTVYAMRKDVKAVIHAHPPILTALTLAGIPFDATWLPEVWVTIGPVPTAPYATPSTQEVPQAIEPFVKDHNAILLERHGSLTYSSTLEKAYFALEKLEHAAYVIMLATIIRGETPPGLTKEQLKKLNVAFGKTT
ncbi:MAG TPA: class II aldolase/adducin family protein [Thermodesulforhabdus norvegica]|uniref:Class II aldolase/adducin family protein n=1 Tax=Thermodesulforhabdus norvegica TaxID=39841 RepID=A0A7C0WVD5_9BACT|nr:class II aldolase/adducin family protein [Deltaproteobacteria bacterium]HDL90612.1 class II aldolase/adducin family protein [Thermodesulforhabdus norvegica]